jgi:hypothetical protein
MQKLNLFVNRYIWRTPMECGAVAVVSNSLYQYRIKWRVSDTISSEETFYQSCFKRNIMHENGFDNNRKT